MSECQCAENFRTAEDYRDHLPCSQTIEAKRKRVWAVLTTKDIVDRLIEAVNG